MTANEIKEKEPGRKVEFVIADGIKVEGDRVMLELVIRNLLQNAWKFTSKRESARIEFGVTHEKAGPIYYVKDEGAGFDMKYADRLFMPFGSYSMSSRGKVCIRILLEGVFIGK